jgi:hypothetical protein
MTYKCGPYVWPLIFITHLCLSGIWECLFFWTETKKTCVTFRLKYVFKYIVTILDSITNCIITRDYMSRDREIVSWHLINFASQLLFLGRELTISMIHKSLLDGTRWDKSWSNPPAKIFYEISSWKVHLWVHLSHNSNIKVCDPIRCTFIKVVKERPPQRSMGKENSAQCTN